MLIVKVGGGKTINWEFIAEDLKSILKKEKVVLVHGANAIRDEIAKKMGHPTKMIISPSGVSSVYTNKEAIDIFLMSYAGLINKRIVATLQRAGVNAVGLSGVDGRLWEGAQKKQIYSVENGKTRLINDNLTGRVEKINTELISLLLNKKYTPVICPPAITDNGEIINTDGDMATIEMARALGVNTIMYLFESPGFLQNFPDESSRIPIINASEIDNIFEMAQGRMKKKVLGIKKAFEYGVTKIYFGDGRIKYPITNCLEGNGTIIQ